MASAFLRLLSWLLCSAAKLIPWCSACNLMVRAVSLLDRASSNWNRVSSLYPFLGNRYTKKILITPTETNITSYISRAGAILAGEKSDITLSGRCVYALQPGWHVRLWYDTDAKNMLVYWNITSYYAKRTKIFLTTNVERRKQLYKYNMGCIYEYRQVIQLLQAYAYRGCE